MNKKNIYKAIVAIAVALAFILPTSAAFANSDNPLAPLANTMVSVDPPTQAVEKGETFNVFVYIEPGDPVASVGIDFIYFDETTRVLRPKSNNGKRGYY